MNLPNTKHHFIKDFKSDKKRLPGHGTPRSLWVIYNSPKDFEGHTVARMHTMTGPTEHLVIGDLELLRSKFKAEGLAKIKRFKVDDPVIVEVWL